MAKDPTFHRLKVSLKSVKPPIWRRIEVSSGLTLAELAPILEAAMGWMGSHLHQFDVNGTRYQPAEFVEDFGSPLFRSADESTILLAEALPDVKSKMRWDYDFGDGWEHDIVVEAIEPTEPTNQLPVCLTGRRSCPPEDCGGPWGYQELLEALADSNHERHHELSAWVPPDFDPTHFVAEETTDAMRNPISFW